jgi:hypothetical protein
MRIEHMDHSHASPARRRGDVARSARRTECALLEHRIAVLEAELEEREQRLESVIDHYEGLLREAQGSPEPEPGGRLRRLLR